MIAKTITYLENNQARMNYSEYRRQGLPVTTAWMESLVKWPFTVVVPLLSGVYDRSP